jgi:hypothetical protein
LPQINLDACAAMLPLVVILFYGVYLVVRSQIADGYRLSHWRSGKRHFGAA